MNIQVGCVCILAMLAATGMASYSVSRGESMVNPFMTEWAGKFIPWRTSRIRAFLAQTMAICHTRNATAVREYMDSMGAYGIGVNSLIYGEDPNGRVVLALVGLTAVTDHWPTEKDAQDALSAAYGQFWDLFVPSRGNRRGGLIGSFTNGDTIGASSPFTWFEMQMPVWEAPINIFHLVISHN
jgi:hypothetical protein